MTTHGRTGTAMYRIWLKARPRVAAWDDFAVFSEAMGDKPKGCVLSRHDLQKRHGPSNTVWLTKAQRKQQLRRVYCERLAIRLDRAGDEQFIRLLLTCNASKIHKLRCKARGVCLDCAKPVGPDRKGKQKCKKCQNRTEARWKKSTGYAAQNSAASLLSALKTIVDADPSERPDAIKAARKLIAKIERQAK